MNTYFKKWIVEAIDFIEGEFNAKQVLEKIVEKHGTSPYRRIKRGDSISKK